MNPSMNGERIERVAAMKRTRCALISFIFFLFFLSCKATERLRQLMQIFRNGIVRFEFLLENLFTHFRIGG